jgi:uncharacterized membrane protein YphA (DoxX/SURF4 family)
MSLKHRISIWASLLLGIIFAAAGFGKLFTPAEGFKTIFNPFPGFMATAFSDAVFNWLPYLEIVIGLLLIIGIMPRFMAVLGALLIAGFITNNAWLLSQGAGYEPCTCFGVLDRILGVELSTTGSLYLDIVMLVMVLIVIFGHQGSFFNIRPRSLAQGKHD